MEDDEDPKAILQDVLDRMGETVKAGAIEQAMQLYSLPYLHEALDARVMLETREDLRIGLDSFANAMHAKGVTQVIRLVSSAEFLSPNYIDGTFVSHQLHNSRPIMRSYTNRTVIRRTGEGWKLTQMQNGFSHQTWPIRIYSVPEDLPDEVPDCETGTPDDARREALEPLAIYQGFINRLTQANVAGDKDGYLAMCALPMWMHMDETDRLIEDAQGVYDFCDAVTKLLEDNHVEDMLRIADHAEFVSANEICGYHTAHFLRAGEPAVDPIKSRLLLRRTGTRWFLHSATNSIRYGTHPFSDPVPTKDLKTLIDIQKRTKTWPTSQ